MVHHVMTLDPKNPCDTDLVPEVMPLLHHRAMWWGVFLGATVVLSWAFQGFREFTLTPTWEYGLLFLGQLLLLALVMVVLTYDSYVKEKRKHNIHHRVPLFEWLYHLQAARSTRRRN